MNQKEKLLKILDRVKIPEKTKNFIKLNIDKIKLDDLERILKKYLDWLDKINKKDKQNFENFLRKKQNFEITKEEFNEKQDSEQELDTLLKDL